MPRQIDYLALAAGILSLILVAVSWFVPWWQFIMGSPAIATVNFSPVNFNFELFNTMLTVPIIWALNIGALLTLLAGGIAMLIYSVIPTKSYAENILGFGYKKPFYALILFLIELGILYGSATVFTGVSFPIVGASVLTLPASLSPGGISVSVAVTAGFGWTFYLAIAVVVLCILARIFHGKVVKTFAVPASQSVQNPLPPPP